VTAAQTSGGTGGGLRYLTEEPAADMLNQEGLYSCVLACVRQLLRDAAVEVSEAEVFADVGLIEGVGSSAGLAATCLSARHPRLIYVGGSLNEAQLPVLFRRDPWIAFLGTDHGSIHSVIVDGCEGEVVSVRDPWGLSGPGSGAGSRARLALADFRHHWGRAIFNGTAPTAIK